MDGKQARPSRYTIWGGMSLIRKMFIAERRVENNKKSDERINREEKLHVLTRTGLQARYHVKFVDHGRIIKLSRHEIHVGHL